MLIANAVVSALLNLILLAGIPFLVYGLYQRFRKNRRLAEIAQRAGLQGISPRYLAWSALVAALVVLALLIWPPAVEPMIRKGSAQHDFAGLGLNGTSIVMALLYGIFKTGFPEELLFRGLIAGSLSRRLPILWANLIQALIFLAPHLLLLRVMPEAWFVLPLVFAGGLICGWLRIRSGSILGPWLIHAAANIVTCLSVAARS